MAAAHHSTGVAAALITHALGGAPAHLWVFETKPRAHAFYAKWGASPSTVTGRSTLTPAFGNDDSYAPDQALSDRYAAGPEPSCRR